LEEAGLTAGPDGTRLAPDGRRFTPDYQVREGVQIVRGQLIQVDDWKKVGLNISPSVLPDVTVPAVERHTWPNIQSQTSHPDEYDAWATSQIGSAANRWSGSNRAGYSNPDFDRLFDSFKKTIDDADRGRISVQILKLLSEDIPGFPVYTSVAVLAHTAKLHDVEFELVSSNSLPSFGWNMHEWTMDR
jgi:ABC-type transport system substrate-binding protein